MLETLITSKTRIKLLLKFFLNGSTSSYLRNLESEFGESSNAIRLELNKFEKAGMLDADFKGNKKIYKANLSHPFFDEIHQMVKKYVGIDRIIDQISSKIGNVEKVYLIGDYAKGTDSGIVDMLLVGDNFNYDYIAKLVKKAEGLVKRKIRFLYMTAEEYKQTRFQQTDSLLLWEEN
ncbi:transcriptional regulator [Marivirga lumbricoides]|uniref:Transcriptional regulator n=1 Tax=Marivirga lumbricoides TaxID=1046115 RepID=A0ABQ1LTQ1_9BACT|nr:transcriptional regulator [Marivirga lumbricoides]